MGIGVNPANLAVAALGFLVGSNVAYMAVRDMCTMPMAVPKTCIQVFSYNEERDIANTINSIHSQHIVRKYPEMFKLQLYDGGSTDDTVSIARALGFETRVVGRGKLRARNLSVIENPDCVVHVHVDADTVLHPCWVQNALAELEKPGVVAVTSPRLYKNQLAAALMVPFRGFVNMEMRVFGSNCAVLHDTFTKTLFDERWEGSPNMVVEEEVNFYNRLITHGIVEYIPTPAYTRPPSKKYLFVNDEYMPEYLQSSKPI